MSLKTKTRQKLMYVKNKMCVTVKTNLHMS